MKRHKLDLFSLIAGLGFASVAALTFADKQWLGAGWDGRWIGPIILIAVGLLVLAPSRKTPTAVDSPIEEASADALAELPPPPDGLDL